MAEIITLTAPMSGGYLWFALKRSNTVQVVEFDIDAGDFYAAYPTDHIYVLADTMFTNWYYGRGMAIWSDHACIEYFDGSQNPPLYECAAIPVSATRHVTLKVNNSYVCAFIDGDYIASYPVANPNTSGLSLVLIGATSDSNPAHPETQFTISNLSVTEVFTSDCPGDTMPINIVAPPPKFQAIDANGNPYAGGKLYTYFAGTTTPQPTYQGLGTGSPNTNPIILDSAGRATIFLLPDTRYKFVLYDANDVLVYSVDQISGDISNLSQYVATATGANTAITMANRFAWSYDVRDFGAVCDGNTDDTAAVQAAIAAFPTVGGDLYYSGQVLISETIVVDKPIRLIGRGGSGSGTALPRSFFLKKSPMTTAGIQLTAVYACMLGGGVAAQAGVDGNGIELLAGSQYLRDVHVDLHTASTTNTPIKVGNGVANVDGWFIDHCSAVNGFNGISIDGDYGTLLHFNANSNFANGVRLETGATKNNLVNVVTASNGGNGIFFNTGANNNTVIGGIRNEATKVVVSASATGNQFFGFDTAEVSDSNTGTSQNTVRAERTIAARGTFTPSLAGSTTPGTQTYSTRAGNWVRYGDFVWVGIAIEMTAKDAATAGNLRITNLPFALPSGLTSMVASAAVGSFGNIDLDAGYSTIGIGIEAGNTYITMTQAGDNVAVAFLAAANLQATTRIYCSLVYPVALV